MTTEACAVRNSTQQVVGDGERSSPAERGEILAQRMDAEQTRSGYHARLTGTISELLIEVN